MLSKSRVAATLPFRGLKAAQSFYTKKIGLKLLRGSPEHGDLEFGAGGGTVLQVFESKSRKSKDTAATFDVANLAREMATLRRRGVAFEDYDLPDIHTVDGVMTMEEGPMAGRKAAWFEDPAGNVIALVQAEFGDARRRRGRSNRRSRGVRTPLVRNLTARANDARPVA